MKAALKTIFFAVTAFVALCVPCYSGGPLISVNHKPVVYSDSDFPVPFSTDQGGLGDFTNAQATALVDECFQVWEDVSTSRITFHNDGQIPVDVTGSNYGSYLNNSSDGINPIIFDSDGSITEKFFGAGSSAQIIGFAGSSYYPSTGHYAEGQALLNGKFSSIFTYDQFKATFVHEFGHFFGLDHTQINLQYAGDGSKSNDQYLPTMFPTSTDDDTTLGELNPDDEASITLLYPASDYLSYYGRITGKAEWPNGDPVLGANIVAVKSGDEEMSRFSSVSDYYMKNDGSYEMLVSPGTYSLFIEPVNEQFTGGSAVGPYADDANGMSFVKSFSKQNYNGTVTVVAGQTVADINFTVVTDSQSTTTTAAGGCPPNFPIDCGNEYCCTEDYPVCGKGDDEGQCFQEGAITTTVSSSTTTISVPQVTTTVSVITSTTSVHQGLCPASLVLGVDSPESDLLRDFRDNFLSASVKGKHLIKLYYLHSPELTSILLNYPHITDDFTEVLEPVLFSIDSANRNGSLRINSNAAKAINDLCDTIYQKAGPELRKDIATFKSEFNHGSLLADMEIGSVE